MTISNLTDLYIDQLQDIYSANKQSLAATKQMHAKATTPALQSALERGADGISQGMAHIKGLIEGHGADPTGEFCKGMEGLVKEAKSHAIDADIDDKDVLDASIIAQYQRMTHYGIAGYGTALAFAKRLGLDNDAKTLKTCLDDTYGGDRTMTEIATGGVNKDAMAA
jgi:ferritin-like metal-binding protein YciE